MDWESAKIKELWNLLAARWRTVCSSLEVVDLFFSNLHSVTWWERGGDDIQVFRLFLYNFN